jgi:hypothetical protein
MTHPIDWEYFNSFLQAFHLQEYFASFRHPTGFSAQTIPNRSSLFKYFCAIFVLVYSFNHCGLILHEA